MTAPVLPPDQPPEWLVAAVRAIESGNWRYVLYAVEAVDAYGEAAVLFVVLQAVASSMRLQTLGEVSEAWKQLGIAARMLPRAMWRLSDDAVTHKAVLRSKPTESGTRVLAWRLARAIFREQAELAALLALLVREHTSPRDVLVDAMIEWMRWVECDPWTCDHRYARKTLPGIGPSRAEFCARSTHLRRFADPTAADLSTAVWTRLGGYFGVREAALRRLAASELAPWTSENPLISDIPVRLGRRRAHERATQWLDDL
jgi:hypothetical protein